MKSLAEIAVHLRERLRAQHVTQRELVARAGLAPRTVTLLLSGKHDFKVGTLLSVLDRLGLELVLAPKAAAAAMQAGEVTEPAVRTRVQAAMDTLASAGTAPNDNLPQGTPRTK